MKIELFHTPGCAKCADSKEGLKATAEQLLPDVVWRELNVIDELDYAVEVGVLTLPAMAINGELVFSSLPTPRQLRRELTMRMKKAV
jgi:thioredoxin 1